MNQHLDADFSQNSRFSIPSFYDSHLHFLGLGKYTVDSNLTEIDNFDDFKNFIKTRTSSSISKFIQCFGLNKKIYTDLNRLVHFLKDFKNYNFYLVADDGHQVFLQGPYVEIFKNTLSTQSKDFKSNEFLFLGDHNRNIFDDFLKSNQYIFDTTSDLKLILNSAQKILHSYGITHCRDLTSDLEQTAALVELDQNLALNLNIETYFSDFFGASLNQLIADSQTALLLNRNSLNIHHHGIKIFIDGTFSQGTASCSCYFKGHKKFKSDTKYSSAEIQDLLLKASENNLEVAFHTIGDLAVEFVLKAYDQVKTRFKTKLHLEHCEIMNSKTINFLETLTDEYKRHLAFHFQPSHYLMDQDFLREAQKDSSLCVFAWDKLINSNFKVHFGSDSPVTKPGLESKPFIQKAKGLLKQNQDTPFWCYLSHPLYRQYPVTFSHFENDQLKYVYFKGKKVFGI